MKMNLKKYLNKGNLWMVAGAFAFVGTSVSLGAMFRPTIDIDLLEGTLMWEYSTKLNDGFYEVLKNDIPVEVTTMRKYVLNSKEDEATPKDITGVKSSISDNYLFIDWEDTEDEGSLNEYKVAVKNKRDGREAISKGIVYKAMSGIENYLVKVDGVEYETHKSEIKIPLQNHTKGNYIYTIQAIDVAGNKSNEYSSNLTTHTPYLSGRDILIDSGKKYKYKAIISGAEIALAGNKIPMEKITDVDMPEKIKKVFSWDRTDSVSLAWAPSKDIGSSHKVEIIGEDGDSQVRGGGIINSKVSGVRGYRYAISNEANRVITSEDKIAHTPFVINDKVNSNVADLYIHIAVEDKVGNVSDTYSQKIR